MYDECDATIHQLVETALSAQVTCRSKPHKQEVRGDAFQGAQSKPAINTEKYEQNGGADYLDILIRGMQIYGGVEETHGTDITARSD